MQQGEQHRGNGVMEKWSNEIFNTPSVPHSNTPTMAATRIRTPARSAYGFALYEVLLGVAIFAIGVVALGRAVQNCLNASSISAEEGAVQQILSDRMAVVQAAPGVPDPEAEFKINRKYGEGSLILNNAPPGSDEE